MRLKLARAAALLAILAALLAPLCFGCGALGLEDTEFPHSENYTVSEGTQVTILSGDVDGDINAEAWGKDYVELTWTRSTTWGKDELEKADVKVTQAAGRLDIETVLSGTEARLTLDYDIKLPRQVALAKVSAGNGNISIAGTDGDTIIVAKTGDVTVKNSAGYLDIAAGKGNLRLEGTTGGARLATADSTIDVVNSDGDVKATTSNSGITISHCKGNMTLETSGSSIRVSNLEGCVLLARTANSPVEISDVTAVETVETSNADIKAEISGVGPNGTTIRVDDGSIDLYVSSGVNAGIELKTLSGEVAISSHTGTLSFAGEFSPQYFKGTVGAGGNLIYAETSNGGVNVYGTDAAP